MDLSIYRTKEDDLIKGCLRRDRTAQQALFDLYSSRMYGVCFRYVKHTMEAEDILVTAFTKVFERLNQFKGEGSFEGWIRRIMINLEQADREPDYTRMSDHLETEDLLNLIQKLPPGYQLVFNMYAIDGYSHKEIGDQLNISENTSKSQLSRARVFLQKLLVENDWNSDRKISNHESAT